MAKAMEELRERMREQGKYRVSGRQVHLENVLPDYGAVLIVNQSGSYAFSCFCGNTTVGNLEQSVSVPPIPSCPMPGCQSGRVKIDVGQILEHFSEHDTPFIYLLKREKVGE